LTPRNAGLSQPSNPANRQPLKSSYFVPTVLLPTGEGAARCSASLIKRRAQKIVFAGEIDDAEIWRNEANFLHGINDRRKTKANFGGRKADLSRDKADLCMEKANLYQCPTQRGSRAVADGAAFG
jgi:hypothetical protein